MSSHTTIKTDAQGGLSVQSIFLPPMRIKVSSKMGFIRQALHRESNGRRPWGRNVAGLFWGRLLN